MSATRCFALFPTALFLVPLSVSGAETTFYEGVLPLLQQRCQECHRPGEAAPMSLMTYEETRPWAEAIREAVLTKRMPPWFADSPHGVFSNDRTLSESEIDLLTDWVEGGAKQGDPAAAPPERTFTRGWTIGEPDLVLDMGYDYQVPADGDVPYTYFAAPTGFTEDKWVESVEVRPGARAVVHHIVVSARSPQHKQFGKIQVGEPHVPEKKPSKRMPDTGLGRLDGAGTYQEIIGVYVPGGIAYRTPKDHARLIPAGSELVFQMHYTTTGVGAVDRSVIGLRFADKPPKGRVINTFISNRNFAIPPGDPNYRVDARITIQKDVELLNFFPHMHLRGKAAQYEAIFPSGERQVLLNVPRYDFNWQLTYDLESPLKLPKGTQLVATSWYDNSPNNPHNPDPSETVHWGDQTWEEMLAAFMDLAVPVDLDPKTLTAKPEPEKPTSE